MQQSYVNNTLDEVEITFRFPMNYGSILYDMKVEVDGKLITSVVEEKETAKDKYDDAIASGHGAYSDSTIVEMTTGAYILETMDKTLDVYAMSLGRLGPKKSCKVYLEYVIPLQNLDVYHSRLIIPLDLVPRYGDQDAFESGDKFYRSIKVSVTGSPSDHVSEIKSNFWSEALEGPKSDWLIQKEITMKKDLVIDVTFDSDETSVVLERLPSTFDIGTKKAYSGYVELCRKSSHDAIQADSEIVFFVDCSGSMDTGLDGYGSTKTKMEMVRESLLLFLKSLYPGTKFNIVAFGSESKSLFDSVQAYDQKTMEMALNFTKKLDSDMGGTEVLKNLEPHLFKDRSIIFLTDGEVCNSNEVIEMICRSQEKSPNCRIFTIGNQNLELVLTRFNQELEILPARLW